MNDTYSNRVSQWDDHRRVPAPIERLAELSKMKNHPPSLFRFRIAQDESAGFFLTNSKRIARVWVTPFQVGVRLQQWLVDQGYSEAPTPHGAIRPALPIDLHADDYRNKVSLDSSRALSVLVHLEFELAQH